MSTIILARERIQSLLVDNGVDLSRNPNMPLGSAKYELPTREYVFGQFVEDWKQFRASYFKQEFREAKTVCRHYAHACEGFMSRQYGERTNGDPECSIQFGHFWYPIEPGTPEGHAVNWFFWFNDVTEKFELLFFEPQVGMWLPAWAPQRLLTAQQIANVDTVGCL